MMDTYSVVSIELPIPTQGVNMHQSPWQQHNEAVTYGTPCTCGCGLNSKQDFGLECGAL